MKKALEGLLVYIWEEERDNDAGLISRSLAALRAAGLRGDNAMVRGALSTCHDAESFAWDLMRDAGVPDV